MEHRYTEQDVEKIRAQAVFETERQILEFINNFGHNYLIQSKGQSTRYVETGEDAVLRDAQRLLDKSNAIKRLRIELKARVSSRLPDKEVL